MSKEKLSFVCSACGAEFLKWAGKCTRCGAWDSLTEEVRQTSTNSSTHELNAALLKNIIIEPNRQILKTGVEQFDQVMGGGIVEGSVGLLGGAPGIGKSTLILQMIARVGKLNKQVLYVTGEESNSQIKLRSSRLGINEDNIHLLCSGDVDHIMFHMDKLKPDFVVIDSIQTMSSKQFPSIQGSPIQVRECASLIHQYAKQGNTAVLLIGHITKEGLIAGPKLLEHLVDYVLYLESVPDSPYRYIYPVKNRYGSIYETGMFKMTARGLVEIQNVSRVFQLTDMTAMSGLAYFTSFEGSRMIMSEVQALVNEDNRQIPVKQANGGIDRSRLLMLIAVIQKHLNMYLGNTEIYINFSGGFKSANSTVDMSVMASIISSRLNLCFDLPTLFLGEVSLTGKFSLYIDSPERLRDTAKLGFKRIVLPKSVNKDAQINNIRENLPAQSADVKNETGTNTRKFPADVHVEYIEDVKELYNFIRNHCKRVPQIRQS